MSRRHKPRVQSGLPKQKAAASCTEDPVERLADEAAREQLAGNFEAAKRLYTEALSRNVRHARSLLGVGLIAYDSGSYEIAAKMMERAIAIDDRQPSYHSCLGAALHAQKKIGQAIAAYEHALRLDPKLADVWSDLGVALGEDGKPDRAQAHYEHALRLNPKHAPARSNLANILRAQGRIEEAKQELERALQLQPDFAEAHNNLGTVLRNLGDLSGARRCYERALALRPDYPQASWNHCILDLQEGNFTAGWRDFEVRYRCGIKGLRNFPQPLWRGEPLDGARILLHSEQGFGDVIQFLRYLPMVRDAGGRLILSVPLGLRRMAAEIPGVEALGVTGEALPEFDWHCPLMSLPYAFRTEMETIPRAVPYLTIPEASKEAAGRLSWPDQGLRVGLVWSGNPDHVEDKLRSIPLRLFEPLLRTEGVDFYSLQVGPGEAELAQVQASITDLRREIRDMADTAALLTHLDLVIAVDTAVVHLAGALARPAWVLLPLVPDWRWLMEGEENPWYPTLRLFRQRKFRAWEPVLERVGQELAALARAKQRA